MSKLSLVELFNKIRGLEDIVNSPIQGVTIPATGVDDIVRSTEDFPFSTPGEFVEQILSFGQESLLDGISNVNLDDEGIVAFNTEIGGNG